MVQTLTMNQKVSTVKAIIEIGLRRLDYLKDFNVIGITETEFSIKIDLRNPKMDFEYRNLSINLYQNINMDLSFCHIYDECSQDFFFKEELEEMTFSEDILKDDDFLNMMVWWIQDGKNLNQKVLKKYVVPNN